MSEKFAVLAAYPLSVEAQLACGRLEAEGIKAVLTGGGSVGVFGGIQGLGGIQLQVAESDAERAAGILAAIEAAAHESDSDRPADDADLWLCPLCGDAVDDDFDVCPACETPRPVPEKSSAIAAAPRPSFASQDVQEAPASKSERIAADAPPEAVPSAMEEDLEVPDMETLVGDDLVRRAFRSALFPVLIPYSLWLLARLSSYSGQISPRMMRWLYWTVALDACWCLLLLLGGWRLLALLVMGRPF